MALSASSLLFAWSARYGINPRLGGRPDFTRSTGGAFVSQEGEVNTAPVNTPRFDWASVSGERRKVLTLESARGNLCTVALTGFAIDGASSVGGQPDPAGGTNAAKVTHTGGNARIYAAATFAGDGTKAVAIALRNGDAGTSAIKLFDATAGVNRHQVNVVWTNGVPAVSTVAGAGTIFPIKPLVDGFYLIAFSATGVVAANSNRVELTPDAFGTGKFVYAYQPNFENGPFTTSFLDPNVTRQTDLHYWSFAALSQALVAYARFVEQGTSLDAGKRIFQIGASDGSAPQTSVYNSGAAYQSHHNNNSTNVTSVGAALPIIGNTVELLHILYADGSVQIVQSINAAAVSSGAQTGACALGAAWSGPRLYLNSGGIFNIGFNKFADIRVVKFADVVAATAQGRIDELRAFEPGPNGDIL